MKKIASILLLVLTFAIDVHAELEEVRGILTKQEVRDDNYYYFIFINENDFPVWLDMELYGEKGISGNYTMEYSKSITLQAGETYAWKPGVCRGNFARSLDQYYTKYRAYKKQ